jgi:hypothetical protein
VLHQTEDIIIRSISMKLEDDSDDVRKVVTDLVKSGFNKVRGLVELAGNARESVLAAQQEWQPGARRARCRGA